MTEKTDLLYDLAQAIDGVSRRALHDAIVGEIQARISSGELRPGELLPPERELSAALKVSRNVVRRAIATLESEGLLSIRQGYGTYVPDKLRKSTNSILGFTEEMTRRAVAVRNEVIHFERRAASPGETVDFGLGLSTRLIELVRVRFANDSPLAHEVCLIPEGAVAPDYDGHSSLYAAMNAAGTRPTRVLQEIGAAAADEGVAEALGVEVGFPLLSISRKGFTKDNSFSEYTITLFRSDKYTWITELQI